MNVLDGQNQWIHHDKVHMFDNTTEGHLKVFISDLTAAVAGTYRCGVNIDQDDLYTEVKLNVNQGKTRVSQIFTFPQLNWFQTSILKVNDYHV